MGHKHTSRRARGLSLMEVLIVMTIISILAAVALPSYSEHVARARRADARTQLLQVAQFMQRFYAANDQYQKDRAGNDVDDQLPAALKQSPADGEAIYNVVFPGGLQTTTRFQVHMVPVSTGPMATDKCGTFTIDSLGVRAVIVSGITHTGALRDTCWK